MNKFMIGQRVIRNNEIVTIIDKDNARGIFQIRKIKHELRDGYWVCPEELAPLPGGQL